MNFFVFYWIISKFIIPNLWTNHYQKSQNLVLYLKNFTQYVIESTIHYFVGTPIFKCLLGICNICTVKHFNYYIIGQVLIDMAK